MSSTAGLVPPETGFFLEPKEEGAFQTRPHRGTGAGSEGGFRPVRHGRDRDDRRQRAEGRSCFAFCPIKRVRYAHVTLDGSATGCHEGSGF